MAQLFGRERGWLLLLVVVLLALGLAVLLAGRVAPHQTLSKVEGVESPVLDGPDKLRVVRSERMGNYLVVTIENRMGTPVCFSRSELFASRNLEDFRTRNGENITTIGGSFGEQLVNGIDASIGVMVADPGATKYLYELDEPAVFADGVVVQPSFLMMTCEDLFSAKTLQPFRVAQKEPSTFPAE